MKIDRRAWGCGLLGLALMPMAAYAAPAEGKAATRDCAAQPPVRMLIWAWNSQMGAMVANGGAETQKDSLVCRTGVNLKFIRQDDTSKMQEDLITFANELKAGTAHPAKGAHFVSIMGDGAATFLK